MKFYINAHAQARNKVVDKLEDNVIPVLQHLAYLYVFENCQDTKHWRTEVWKFMSHMPKVRIGAKVRYLLPSEFLKYTYYQHNSLHEFEYVIEAAVELKPEYEPNWEKVYYVLNFKHLCDNYFNWLSEEICKVGTVSPKDCYTKLEELGL